MRRVRRLPAPLGALAILLAAAACGGGDGAPAGGGAELVPASTALFVSLNTDTEGDQWRAAADLVAKFPDGPEALREALAHLDEEDVDLARDVEPAFGPETDVAILNVRRTDDFVVLTQPDDPAKFEEFVTQGDVPGVVAELDDGWWAGARSRDAIDALTGGDRESLADSDAWDDATSGLPEDRLAAVFVNRLDLNDQLGSGDSDDHALPACLADGGRTGAQAYALNAEDDGVALEGRTMVESDLNPETSGSELDDVLPADGLLAFASVSGLDEPLGNVLRCLGDSSEVLGRGIAQVELALGVSLEEDVLPLLGGESALAVYESESAEEPVPVLALAVDDEVEALETLDRIAERIGVFQGGVRIEKESSGGIEVRHVFIGDDELFVYGGADGRIGFSTSAEGLAAIGGDGPVLADDAAYVSARDTAAVPGETAGFVYVATPDAVDEVLEYAGDDLGAHRDRVERNLEPLRSLVLWGEIDGDTVTTKGFAQID